MVTSGRARPRREAADKPFIRRVLPDIVAFGIGLGIAYLLKWETTDLVWSLWLCSLVLGYLTLLSTIGGGAYIGICAVRHKDFKKEHRKKAILIGTAVGLFFLGFFSIHFCGFHAGHSAFLGGFFPVEGMPNDGFGSAFSNPPLLWFLVFKHLMKPYGIFLVPAIIAERKHVFRSLFSAVRAVRRGMTPDGPVESRRYDEPERKDSHPIGDAMARPYVNVVRMHMLIFFFGFCHALKIDNFLVYAVVYSVYFFPWSEFKRLKARQKRRRR